MGYFTTESNHEEMMMAACAMMHMSDRVCKCTSYGTWSKTVALLDGQYKPIILAIAMFRAVSLISGHPSC